MSEKDLFINIKKEHILQAIERIDEEGYPPNRKSNTYDLVYNGTVYPPKYVMSLAGYLANERFIRHNEFSGGEKSVAFEVLRSFGFEIQLKTETHELKRPKEVKDIHHKYGDRSEKLSKNSAGLFEIELGNAKLYKISMGELGKSDLMDVWKRG